MDTENGQQNRMSQRKTPSTEAYDWGYKTALRGGPRKGYKPTSKVGKAYDRGYDAGLADCPYCAADEACAIHV